MLSYQQQAFATEITSLLLKIYCYNIMLLGKIMGTGLKKLSRPDGEMRMQRSVVLPSEVGCEAGEGRGLSLPEPAMGFPLRWGGIAWGQVRWLSAVPAGRARAVALGATMPLDVPCHPSEVGSSSPSRACAM